MQLFSGDERQRHQYHEHNLEADVSVRTLQRRRLTPYLSARECQCDCVNNDVESSNVSANGGGGGEGEDESWTCRSRDALAYVCQSSQNTLPMTLKAAMTKE